MSPQFPIDVSLLLGATALPLVLHLLGANTLVRDMRRECFAKPFGFTLLSARHGSSWSWALWPMRAIVAAQTYLGQEVM